MVLQHRRRRRYWIKTLILFAALSLGVAASALADDGPTSLRDAQSLFQSGQYFKAARYAFAASQQSPELSSEAYSWITVSLVRAGLPNAASYFFVRTLQGGNTHAIRRALTSTEVLLEKVGPDLLRKYMIGYTHYEDYDSANRSAYLFALGKDALLSDADDRAIGYLNAIQKDSVLYPYALELRGSAYAISGKNEAAINDFKNCADRAPNQDLRARCIAGQARTLYQMDQFEEADRVYDSIPKQSMIWPDILFEQGWNSFAKQEYNRTLGKLVSYQAPALRFVFNSEVEVLRAQSYLGLCLYGDANTAINDFNTHYTAVGEAIGTLLKTHESDLSFFYDQGKAALADSLYTVNQTHHFMERFVRTPYFQQLVQAEKNTAREWAGAQQYALAEPGTSRNLNQGFPGFLQQVIHWRLRSIHLMGGAFVKNSLLDYHSVLVSDFEKMAFIKLEMLRRAKDKLVYKKSLVEDRSRGSIEPHRRDDQMYWNFNGEFWNDELGDYVFGLASECSSSS